MTDEKIDRVESAQHLLDQAQGKTIAEAVAVIAAAQVHATLALVDQQRIANVIAMKQLHVGSESGDDLEVTDTGGMIRWCEEQLGLEREWDRRLADEMGLS